MGKGLLSEYRSIWDSLKEITPIVSNVSLKTYPPSDLSDIGDTTGGTWDNTDSNVGWANTEIK
jgi:hypothetical protein